jgi:hypothetical protein
MMRLGNTATGGTKMRTATEIKAELTKRMDWAKKQNELQGGTYDYTDSTEINDLMDELTESKNAEWNDPAIVTARREAWNADAKAGMKMGDLCKKYGYSYHGKLVAAIKTLGL